MALINSSTTVRLIPPHEPETWFMCRPIRAGDFEALNVTGSQVTVSLDLAATLIQSWSYPEPVTREYIAMLDVDTFTWLNKAIQEMSGIRTDAEKKESSNGSSPSVTPEPAAASSQTNSGI